MGVGISLLPTSLHHGWSPSPVTYLWVDPVLDWRQWEAVSAMGDAVGQQVVLKHPFRSLLLPQLLPPIPTHWVTHHLGNPMEEKEEVGEDGVLIAWFTNVGMPLL